MITMQWSWMGIWVLVGIAVAIAGITIWALKWPNGFERVWNRVFRREKL